MIKLRKYSAIFVLILVLASSQGALAAGSWVGAWGASPSYTCGAGCLQGYTLRTIIRVSAGGSQIRVRLSNDLTSGPATFTNVSVALPGSTAGSINAATATPVTFSGSTSVTVAGYGNVLSDPINMTVSALSTLAISLYVSSATAGITYHENSLVTCYVATGNQSTAATLSGSSALIEVGGLSGVDVLETSAGGTIVTLGDSITAGWTSTQNGFLGWPDNLAALLKANSSLANLSVLNAGIPGNRLLLDDVGNSGLARLPRDVLSQASVNYIIVALGTNDIGYPNYPSTYGTEPAMTAAQLEAGYLQIIAKGHELGLKVLLATITPFGGTGSGYYTTATEAVREATNTWIRATATNGADGVLDFDAAIRDPNTPTQILATYNSGDNLHPNNAGYAAMAKSINLSLFQTP